MKNVAETFEKIKEALGPNSWIDLDSYQAPPSLQDARYGQGATVKATDGAGETFFVLFYEHLDTIIFLNLQEAHIIRAMLG